MTPDRWAQVEDLFNRALECEPDQRLHFVEGTAGTDTELRREVESLLACRNAAQFDLRAAVSKEAGEIAGADSTEAQNWAALQSLYEAALVEKPEGCSSYPAKACSKREVELPGGEHLRAALPASVGRYRILGLLGEGGMGLVYEAEQDQPRRLVALKVIKSGFASVQQLRRFEQESQVLGRLQHSGIAQIYEAGIEDSGFGPRPYFAMELIRGESLVKYAEAHYLGVRQRLQLIAKVCEGVHHAHQRSVIHRDLKPGNILVDESGQPKILDFGIARATDSDAQVTRQTDIGQLIGTLAYMSPEQVEGDSSEIDTRSDVYSLGVILYELLAGCMPYKIGQQLFEAAQAIRETDPAPLHTISRAYRGDIETIVAKALEKDKERRYSSAADFAGDIWRYLNDEPIIARSASGTYQLLKFARRHQTLVAGVFAVFVVLTAGIIASTREAARAIRAEKSALLERDQASAARRLATEERDRALTAEQTATSQRNRAAAAEALALEQRNQAIAEKRRADTEAATAKAVNDFLQNDLLGQATATEHGWYVDHKVGVRHSAKIDPDLRLRTALSSSHLTVIRFVADKELKVRTVLDRAAGRVTRKFDQQPIVEASIRQTIANAYLDLGLYPEAQRNLERALELRRRALGEDHRDTIETILSLAALSLAQSRKISSFMDRGVGLHVEAILTEVLNARRRNLGENDPDTLTSMDVLGLLWLRENKTEQALQLLRKALAIERQVLGDENPITLMTMNDLADAYMEDQANPPAIQSARAAPSTKTATLPVGPTKYEQAEQLLSNSMRLSRRVLGEDHPDTLSTMRTLAALYREDHKYPQAEEMYKQIIEVTRRSSDRDDLQIYASMDELADFYYQTHKYPLAEIVYQELLDMQPNPPTMQRLADSYYQDGKYADAEPLYIGILEENKRTRHEESGEMFDVLSSLGLVYLRQHKYDQASPILIRASDLERRLYGKENVGPLSQLAFAYFRDQHYEQAETLFTKVLEARKEDLGEHNFLTLGTMINLAAVYLFEGRHMQSEALAREALKHFEESDTSNNWQRFNCESVLGESLAAQKRYSEAEPELISGFEGMQRLKASVPSDDRFLVTRAGRWVVRLYQDWEKPEKAAEWREKMADSPAYQ